MLVWLCLSNSVYYLWREGQHWDCFVWLLDHTQQYSGITPAELRGPAEHLALNPGGGCKARPHQTNCLSELWDFYA